MKLTLDRIVKYVNLSLLVILSGLIIATFVSASRHVKADTSGTCPQTETQPPNFSCSGSNYWIPTGSGWSACATSPAGCCQYSCTPLDCFTSAGVFKGHFVLLNLVSTNPKAACDGPSGNCVTPQPVGGGN